MIKNLEKVFNKETKTDFSKKYVRKETDTIISYLKKKTDTIN